MWCLNIQSSVWLEHSGIFQPPRSTKAKIGIFIHSLYIYFYCYHEDWGGGGVSLLPCHCMVEPPHAPFLHESELSLNVAKSHLETEFLSLSLRAGCLTYDIWKESEAGRGGNVQCVMQSGSWEPQKEESSGVNVCACAHVRGSSDTQFFYELFMAVNLTRQWSMIWK